jgi:hypothetical protein
MEAPNKFRKLGRLIYSDQFIGKTSLSITIKKDLALDKDTWLGFDSIDLYATGCGDKSGTIVSGALNGDHTYDDLREAVQKYFTE